MRFKKGNNWQEEAKLKVGEKSLAIIWSMVKIVGLGKN